jgi:hypothetical protein
VVLLHLLGNRVHDDSTAMNPIIVVSRISSVLKPSTPRSTRADRWNPLGALNKLEVSLCGLPEPERDRDGEPGERGDVRDPPDGVLVLLRHEQYQKRADERQKQDERADSDS